MTKYLTEMLEEIAADSTAIVKYKDSTALKMLLEYAFLLEKKFILPIGDPPYKPDAAPLGMCPTNLMQEIRRLYIFTAAKDLYPTRREQLFIQLLETVHPSEAKLMLAVKDQTLLELYPGLDVAALVNGGMLPQSALNQYKDKKPESTIGVVKRKPGRPKKVKV